MNIRNLMPSFRLASMAGMLLGASTAHAAVEISNTPLQTGSAVPPNIMFIIDDSGSMHFELLPDNIVFGDKRYIFPRANNVYGPSDYNNYVPTVESGEPYNALTRSPQQNRSYYDPAVTYKPWVRADGSSFPNANPACAWHNPINTGACPTDTSVNSLARDLTRNNGRYNSNRWYKCSSSGSCSYDTNNRSFWPATYFFHEGGSAWNWDNYTKVEIKNTTPSYSGHGRTTRTDCANGTCTYNQEMQNFANWYTYHRSRILTSRGAIGQAFVNQSEKMRVGFGAINKGNSTVDSVNTSVIVRGVREFKGAAKSNFYSDLYTRDIPAAGTPLLSALDAAGRYFSREDSRGPWGLNPGSGDESTLDHITCRQNFTILMTDGYWSDGNTAPNIGNQDGTPGLTIQRPEGDAADDYKYEPVGPFADSHSTTLADVAMKYWKNDLRLNLINNVPSDLYVNPAFWQHMVTFGVGLGVTGKVVPKEAFDAVGPKTAIKWDSPFAGDTDTKNSAKIDDLLHASLNSRGGFFTAERPDIFAMELENTLNAIAGRVASASNLTGTTTSLQTENFVYQGSLNSTDWSGSLKAKNVDQLEGVVWESNFPAWDARNILFGRKNGTATVFTPANVTADANALSGKDTLVNYLRGDKTLESGNNAQFRPRSSLLGDIANSSPAYVAASVNRDYQRYNWEGTGSYQAFLAAQKTREPVVYVGANDGMLHAFDGTTGTELMAYVPQKMLTAEANLADYASKTYKHKYYVDGSPVVADAYINGNWRTILLGSLGRGGNSLFAIDVTDPQALAGENKTQKILWDKSFPELGITTSKPAIARLNNGKWAAVVGFGYNNSTNKAGLLVIDLADGSVIRTITTNSASENGLGQIEGWDRNSDGNTDWFFGGDLKGNVWKFDLSDQNPAVWGIAYEDRPLFTAVDDAGVPQPITGGVSLSSQPETGQLWVFFGTGKMLSAEDPLLSDANTWYGIRDGIVINNKAELKQRQIIAQQDNARVIESGAPYDMADLRGWYINLNDPRERIVNRPQVVGNSLVINTVAPGDNECNPQGSGWIMSVNPYSGGRLNYTYFDRNKDNKFDNEDGLTVNGDVTPVSAVRFDGMPSEPAVFRNDDGTATLVTGLADTRIADTDVQPGFLQGRVSWRELTNQ